jgi:hypothetical protein
MGQQQTVNNVYAVQKDVWHLTGLDKTIVEQLLR